MDTIPMVDGMAYDQGDPTSPPGECYLLSAAWTGRGGKTEGSSMVGVFASADAATEAILRWVASIVGRHRAAAMVKANRLSASMRVLEPSDLEQMAALVRQHRANLAGGSEG